MRTNIFLEKLLLTFLSLIVLIFTVSGCGGSDGNNNSKKISKNCAIVDFEHYLTAGTSVEGLGTVHPYLNISTSDGSSIVITEGAIWAYSAPNEFNLMWSGCIGNPGGGVPVAGYGKGFADNKRRHDYVFTFAPGTTVEEFSITMLDFGDDNPANQKYHEVALTAYNATDNVVDKDVLSYNSSTETNPRTSDFADLWYAGDACTARVDPPNKDPGVWTFKVTGANILKVKFEIVSGMDPYIGFDNISFCLKN
jgi:hypothetical protein